MGFLSELTPVWAVIVLPAIGVQGADQNGAIASIPVGHAMVMMAALTGFGTREGNIVEPKLRSQNMHFALLTMPTGTVCLAKAIVGAG